MSHEPSISLGMASVDSPMGDSEGPLGLSESLRSTGNMPRRSESRTAGSVQVEYAPARPENRDPMMANIYDLVASLRREVAELKEAQAPRVQVPALPASPPRRQEGNFRDYLTILEHMRGIGTGRFRGTINPIDADAWLEGLRRNLSVSRCPDDYRKDVAVFFLERDAIHWWKGVERRYGNTVIRWDDFQREFQSKYFPPEARERLEVQFLQLQQGNLSVREYEAEFTRLSQYASGGGHDEATLVRKFIRGLGPCLRNRLQAVEFRTLGELVERAALVEEGLVEENAVMRAHSTPSVITSVSGRREGTRRNVIRRNDRNDGDRQGRMPFCRQCKTRHIGQCRREPRPSLCYNCRGAGHIARDCPHGLRPNAGPSAANITCFTCGQVGHYASSCPSKKMVQRTERPALAAPSAKRPATAARVYALEAGPSNAAVEKSKDKQKDPIAG